MLLGVVAPFVIINHIAKCTEEDLQKELIRYRKMDEQAQRRYLISKYFKGLEPKEWTIAFKGFHKGLVCLNNFHYKEGKTYYLDGDPNLCNRGFHACIYPRDCFIYYSSYSDVYHLVFLKNIDTYHVTADSKRCAGVIKIGPEIPREFFIN